MNEIDWNEPVQTRSKLPIRILCTDGENIMISLDEMLSKFEHSIDQGKTWLPCGVSM